MLSIDESNEIVRKTIYDNMTTSTKVTKTFEEFGHFKYAIYLNEDKNIKFCFNCDDFEKIYEYSGKEFIENDLKSILLLIRYDTFYKSNCRRHEI